MKLQLVAVGTKMPDWVQTGFTEYLRRFPKDMPFELIEIPAGKRGKNADIKRILDKEPGRLCRDGSFSGRRPRPVRPASRAGHDPADGDILNTKKQINPIQTSDL